MPFAPVDVEQVVRFVEVSVHFDVVVIEHVELIDNELSLTSEYLLILASFVLVVAL